jgi:hypothetical protein
VKKLIIALAVGLTLSGTASAATAFWTGRMETGQSVTGRFVYNCEYNYAGNTFWRAFGSYCPSSVEVY